MKQRGAKDNARKNSRRKLTKRITEDLLGENGLLNKLSKQGMEFALDMKL